MSQNDLQKAVDSLSVRPDDKSGMLLWKYSNRSRRIIFFGRTEIEHYFGRSDESFSTSWEGFLDHWVLPEDQAKLDAEQKRIQNELVDSSEPVHFKSSFRFKIFGRNAWIPVHICGLAVSNDGNDVSELEIGGTIRETKDQESSAGECGKENSSEQSSGIRFLRAALENSRAIEAGTQQMLDSMPFGCALWDKNENCVGCNQEMVELFDLASAEEYISVFPKLSPEFQPDGRNSMEQIRKGIAEAFENGSLKFEWFHQNLRKEPIPVEVILVRIRQDGQDFVAAYLRDLRELKKTQVERDRERHLLFEILNTSPVCFTFAVDGIVRVVTPFMTDFLGVKIGDRLTDFSPDPTVYQHLKDELKESGEITWRPVTVRTAYGDCKEMLANVSYQNFNDEKGAIIWLTDVTEIRQVEADLRLARDAAEDSARAKSEFLANMSHEIRTPMNAILGMTHLALRTNLTPKQLQYLESTEHSAKLLLRIINDILDFSKIEAGKMLMEYHEFSMTDIVADLNSIVGESIRTKGLRFDVDLPDKLSNNLMGDSVRLRQVLVNLITNAIKFTKTGGEIRLSVKIDEQDMLSTKLHFDVSDSGIGMTPIQVKALFRPFTQADTSTTRKYGGTGLGLAISKKIVELMKGDIWCKSEVGKGTTFSFTARFGLPLEETVQTDEIRTDVLLLGDNHATLKEIRNYLELLKCKTVAQCETLEEFDRFLKSSRTGEIDFIVCDFDEIQHHGIPILQELLSRYGDQLPATFFTEHRDLDDLLKKTGFPKPEKRIHKPIIVGELFEILVSLTEKKKKMIASEKRKSKHFSLEVADSNVFDYNIPESIRGSSILLAEDNKINQIVAVELLTSEGFVVDIAENGRQAVDKICRNHYDLVLMDIQMPELDGLEATRIIRGNEEFKNLPILAMTAHAISGDRELSLEAGMNDHITKPIEPKLLFQTLARWLKKDKESFST